MKSLKILILALVLTGNAYGAKLVLHANLICPIDWITKTATSCRINYALGSTDDSTFAVSKSYILTLTAGQQSSFDNYLNSKVDEAKAAHGLP